MPSPNNQHSPRRPKKACTQCRQQKARCDAYLDLGKPCSRCQKFSIECIISEPFKREHKRRKLDELEHETDRLRQQLRSPQKPEDASTNTPLSMLTAAAELSAAEADITTYNQDTSPQPSGAATLPRALQDHLVEAAVIDELFEIYFRDFAQFLPILDAKTTPNIFYSLSPLLFWAIIATACRIYSNDPTLLSVLRPRVHNLALASIKSLPTLYSVQGLLILLNWPFPKTYANPDCTFPLSGSLLHVALQMGLHMPVSSQEYSRVRLHLTNADLKQRAELWAFSILLYQRTCQLKGLPSLALSDVCQDIESRQMLYQCCSKSLAFHVKVQDLVTRCCKAQAESGLRIMNPDRENMIGVLVKTFQSQLDELAHDDLSPLEDLHLAIASLNNTVFHLFKMPSSLEGTTISELYSRSCQVIEKYEAYSLTTDIRASPLFLIFGIVSAMTVLTRISKLPSQARYIDAERAKTAVFLAVNLLKRLSIEHNDSAARASSVQTLLWNSKKAFRYPDSSDGVPLRIRSRLVMSQILDGLVWWREESGSENGIYPTPLPQASPNSTNLQTAMPAIDDVTLSQAAGDLTMPGTNLSYGDEMFSTFWGDDAFGWSTSMEGMTNLTF